MTTQTIRFYHRGAIREIRDLPATRTILQYLREDLHCTGTKEGCAEGDCGACTVVLGERDAVGDISLKAINACIQFVPTLDGRALFTVEDLRRPDGSLHPVQQAMVDCHGSQCGFCTPGFVMSMWALYENYSARAGLPSRGEINDALSGNLCRCTGYRPIIDATLKMFEYPRAAFDAARVAEALRGVARAGGLTYAAPPAGCAAAAESAESAARDGTQPDALPASLPTFYAPRTLQAFAALRLAHPNARLLAGGTDVGLWVTKQFRELGDLLYIGNVAELKAIDAQADAQNIGAAASLQDAFAALAADYPELAELWTRFASLPIRNAGTLGGNVANGSPIGDSMPALIALGSEVVLRRGERTRTLPLEAFYLAYQKTALEPGEFLQAVRVPRPDTRLRFRTYKLSKRYDQDISAVCAAFALHLSNDGSGTVTSARIAFGGMAATPKRATRAEAALLGTRWDEAAARRAMQALGDDYQPLSDMRASGAYRLKAARNLLLRFYLETREQAPLTMREVNAFAYDDC